MQRVQAITHKVNLFNKNKINNNIIKCYEGNVKRNSSQLTNSTFNTNFVKYSQFKRNFSTTLSKYLPKNQLFTSITKFSALKTNKRSKTTQVISRRDYKPPNYLIPTVNLKFELHPTQTIVTSTLTITKNTNDSSTLPLILNRHPNVKLVENSLKIDGKTLNENEFQLNDENLEISHEIFDGKSTFQLESKVEINPSKDTGLEGIYISNDNFYSQCEPHGFRRITFFVDRPDNMSKFTVEMIANKEDYPVLLSNGNEVDKGDLNDGKHFIKYNDPWPKPSYLFALVAGKLHYKEDHFIRKDNEKVQLRIYVRENDLNKTNYAIESLKRSMKWDEEEYGRIYDLNVFNIVAVDDFNFGAMENKSLNIFNSKYILANPEITTDREFNLIESVIAHEYFHNWSGNRVTCRDWFQLSLKEGLTVFRDQEFSAEMTSRSVKRIQDIINLKTNQFKEDSGPTSHPVRPDSYIEVNNFYTSTVYEKGAEIIRMLKLILGKDGYRKGTDLYFDRFDGKAVTCDDWINTLQDANPNVDLDQFKLWYSQSGTPEVFAQIRRIPIDDDENNNNKNNNDNNDNNNNKNNNNKKKGRGKKEENWLEDKENIRLLNQFLNLKESGDDIFIDGKNINEIDADTQKLFAEKLDYFGKKIGSENNNENFNFKVEKKIEKENVELILTQKIPPTPNQPIKKPMHIPISLGIFHPDDGSDHLFDDDHHTKIIHLKEEKQIFLFKNVIKNSNFSLFRSFSAPIKLHFPIYENIKDQSKFIQFDRDPINRYLSFTKLSELFLSKLVKEFSFHNEIFGNSEKLQLEIPNTVFHSLKAILEDTVEDNLFKTLMLTLPTESFLFDNFPNLDPSAIHFCRLFTKKEIGIQLGDQFQMIADQFKPNKKQDREIDNKTQGKRSIRNLSLDYLAQTLDQKTINLLSDQVINSGNMTNSLSSLSSLFALENFDSSSLLEAFYQKWKDEYLVINKWIQIQSSTPRSNSLLIAQSLKDHVAFNRNNPNNNFSLFGGFSSNSFAFHKIDGSGYQFIADNVIECDRTNPNIAARIVSAFLPYKKFDEKRKSLVEGQLQRIIESPNLSKNVFELVNKALQN